MPCWPSVTEPSREILAQIKLVGVNNIVIKPIIEQEEEKLNENTGGKKEKKKFSPGLTVRDVNSIEQTIPGITKMSPEIILNTYVIRSGIRRSAKLVGIDPAYFDIFSFELQEGQRFNAEQLKIGAPVCVIGNSIKAKFFPTEDPIGKSIKVGPHWLKIVGVMKERLVSKKQHQQARHSGFQHGHLRTATNRISPVPEQGCDLG